MKIIDIANRHKKKYVAFMEDLHGNKIIVGMATLASLSKFISGKDYAIINVYDTGGRPIEFMYSAGFTTQEIGGLALCLSIFLLFLSLL